MSFFIFFILGTNEKNKKNKKNKKILRVFEHSADPGHLLRSQTVQTVRKSKCPGQQPASRGSAHAPASRQSLSWEPEPVLRASGGSRPGLLFFNTYKTSCSSLLALALHVRGAVTTLALTHHSLSLSLSLSPCFLLPYLLASLLLSLPRSFQFSANFLCLFIFYLGYMSPEIVL